MKSGKFSNFIKLFHKKIHFLIKIYLPDEQEKERIQLAQLSSCCCYACNIIKLSAYLFTRHDDSQSKKLAKLERMSSVSCFMTSLPSGEKGQKKIREWVLINLSYNATRLAPLSGSFFSGVAWLLKVSRPKVRKRESNINVFVYVIFFFVIRHHALRPKRGWSSAWWKKVNKNNKHMFKWYSMWSFKSCNGGECWYLYLC